MIEKKLYTLSLNKNISNHVVESEAQILNFIHIPKTGGTYIEERGRSIGLDWGMYSSYYLNIFKEDKTSNNKRIAPFQCLAWHIPTVRSCFIFKF